MRDEMRIRDIEGELQGIHGARNPVDRESAIAGCVEKLTGGMRQLLGVMLGQDISGRRLRHVVQAIDELEQLKKAVEIDNA